MRRTPSYLRGLAETRARAAGDIQRYQVLLEDINARLADAQAEVDACDRLIRKYDSRLNPELIEPIRAQRAQYEGRGKLKGAIARILKERAPASVTTTELCWELQLLFQLDFITPQERLAWQHGTVGRALKKLVVEGLVERLHDPKAASVEVGRWRWKTDVAPSLDHLRAQAEAEGVGVQQADDARE